MYRRMLINMVSIHLYTVVCFIGDELIRETELQQYNASEESGVLYILASNPVQCTGRVTTVETCVYATYPEDVTNESNIVLKFRLYVSVFRFNNNTAIYNRLFPSENLDLQDVNNVTNTYCFQKSITSFRNWLVQQGDVLGVYVPIPSENMLYPAQPVITPNQTSTNVGVLYDVTSDFSGNVARFRLSTSQAIVNVRASVGKTINTTCVYVNKWAGEQNNVI